MFSPADFFDSLCGLGRNPEPAPADMTHEQLANAINRSVSGIKRSTDQIIRLLEAAPDQCTPSA